MNKLTAITAFSSVEPIFDAAIPTLRNGLGTLLAEAIRSVANRRLPIIELILLHRMVALSRLTKN